MYRIQYLTVQGDHFQQSGLSYEKAMQLLEYNPLGTLQRLGQSGWEDVFVGAEEFAGVMPEYA